MSSGSLVASNSDFDVLKAIDFLARSGIHIEDKELGKTVSGLVATVDSLKSQLQSMYSSFCSDQSDAEITKLAEEKAHGTHKLNIK